MTSKTPLLFLTEDDFHRTIGRLDVRFLPHTVVSWRQFIPQLPEELYERLSENLPYSARFDFEIGTDGCGKFKLDLTDGERQVAEAERHFHIGEGVAHNDGFIIYYPEDRGIGICKHFMYNVFKIYKGWGIHTVHCTAGLTDGGYTWARYGFKISADEWKRLQPDLHNKLWGQYMDYDMQDSIARLISLEDPMGLWFVSDLTTPLGTSTVGRVLLSGLNWKGTFDFDDPECIARFNGRVEAEL